MHHAIDSGEVAADKYVAVRLQGDGIDNSINSCARVETAVETAISIEASDVTAVRAVKGREESALTLLPPAPV
jgi:hypothetical protein